MKSITLLMTILLFAGNSFAKDPDPKTSGEYATLHVYRSSAAAAVLCAYRIKVNGEKIKVRNGHSYEMKLKPGKLNLKVCSIASNNLALDVEAGKEYYIKTYLRAGLLFSTVELAEVTPQFAELEERKIKDKHKKHVEL